MSNYQIKQMVYTNKKYKKARGSVHKPDINYINNYDDSLINTVQDVKDLVEFKDLTIDVKLALLNDYLEDKNMDEEDKVSIINMVKEGVIKNKNSIFYDRVNKNILKIPLLELNINTDIYILKKKKTVKKTSSKKLVQKLLI
jgi:hypothetical protein